MTVRRVSRGTPAMLTTAEQEHLVRMLDTNSQLRDAVETLIGRKLDSLKFGERLTALHDYMESGRELTAVNIAARAVKDLINLAADQRGEVSLADRVQVLEAENDRLREALEIEKRTVRDLSATLVAKTAQPAMAVNSGERVA